ASLEARVVISAFRHVLISSFLETSRRQIVASVTVQFSGRCSPRPEIAPHAPATLLIERARELGAPAVSPAHRMMLA
ncbi:hypothetical protein, partial [Paenirhodobacter ferrireducens]|uniref:hypothetical protein n=1 Tax=Paenirhodobacter ferrireducens TaxID=1215032 RepID=UPI0019D0B552